MSAGIAAMVFLAMFLPTQVRAQSRPADADDAMLLPLHFSMPTSVRLPDEIEHARLRESGAFLSEIVGREVIVRPHLDTPAGTEALLDVKTATLRRRFLLRVVARAEDAVPEVVISAAERAESAPAERAESAPAERAESAPAAPEASPDATPAVPAPPQSPLSEAPPSTAVPAGPARAATDGEGAAAADAESTTADDESTTTADDRREAAGSSRFDLSVHAVVALAGTTEVDIAGYEARRARQPHRAFGMRVVVARPCAWWGVEANVSGEWPTAPTTYDGVDNDSGYKVEMRGPWLRSDVGVRAQFRTRWSPTVYAGVGLQAHHRDIEKSMTEDDGPVGDMPFGGVLALGMGLQYRAEDVLLGLELHVRQGVPDNYHSVAALLSVGYLLPQGE